MNAIVSSSNRSAALGSNDRLLRLGVQLDAVVSGGFGVVLLAGGAFLGDLLGMPSVFLWAIGGVCLVYAAALWLLQARPVIPAAAGWTVVIANCLWVAASVLLVVLGWLTPLGIGFVLLQALVVAGMAELQFVGLRRA